MNDVGHRPSVRAGGVVAALALALAACGEDATQPTGPAEPQAVTALATASNIWITRRAPPLPAVRPAIAMVPNAAGQSLVYVMSGNQDSRVQVYNVASNTWTLRAYLPVRMNSSNGAGVIGGKIYVSGGRISSIRTHAQLNVYDPATNKWTRKHDMPAPTWGGVTGVINNRLYVLAGCNDGPCYFFRYDPATDHWTTLPNSFQQHELGVGGVIGGKFYVVGGRPFVDPRILEVYDPATNAWTKKAPLAMGLEGAAGAVLQNRLFVVGGRETESPDTVVATTHVYDPATNRWITKAPLPAPASAISATKVLVNGQPRLEVVGGSASHWEYIP
jgi:N-acetylneuraminic acid mutarotase